MDVGFIILCPDRNVGGLRNSVGGIRHRSYDRECLAVVPGDTSPKEIKEMKEHCPAVWKGKDTITSLINTGMKRVKQEWGFIIFAGSRIPAFIEKKFITFANAPTDILFPVVERRFDFVSGSFNGVLINKEFFKKVGNFTEGDLQKQGMNDFEMAKFLWSITAIENGAMFKGIVGMRVI